jgi:hypothetical protein
VQVVVVEGCPATHDLRHKAAANCKPTSPCTNLPAKCPVCTGEVFVWSYHMLDHLESMHPEYPISEQLLEQYAIKPREFEAVIEKYQPKGASAREAELQSLFPDPAAAPAKWRLLLTAAAQSATSGAKLPVPEAVPEAELSSSSD